MKDNKSTPRKKTYGTVTNACLVRIPRGDVTYPAIVFAGDIPVKGEKIGVVLKNGITYTGTVFDATEADGEVLVEFTDGLTPTHQP